jgi:hypothetical protein
MLDLRRERLRRLPLDPDAVWQGAWRELPGLRIATDTEPRTYLAGLWADRDSGMIGPASDVIQPAENATPERLFDRLVEFATSEQWGGRCPGRIEVDDAVIADYLAGVLEGLDVEVVPVRELAVIDAAVDDLAEHLAQASRSPLDLSLLAAPDLPLAQVVEFGAAAAEFHRAEPWLHFCDEDLITIEAPDAPRELQHVVILGAAGYQFGLGFYADPGDHAAVLRSEGRAIAEDQPVWFFSYCDADDPEDRHYRELMREWRARGMPLAGANAYPLLVCRGRDGEPLLPGPDELAHVTGLLRALSRTPLAEADTGRWTVTVGDGRRSAVEYRLALPGILERPVTAGVPRRLPASEQAEILCEQSRLADGFRQGALARAAMRVDPDSIEGHTLLAETEPDPARRAAFRRRAAELALTRLDDLGPSTPAGGEEPMVPARDARARAVLHALGDMAHDGMWPGAGSEPGDQELGLRCGLEILARHPADTVGVRHGVVATLLRQGRDEEAAAVLARWPERAFEEHDFAGDPLLAPGGPGALVGPAERIFVDTAAAILAARAGEATTELTSRLADLARRNRFLLGSLWQERQPPASAKRNTGPGGGRVAEEVADLLGDVWRAEPALVEARPRTGRSSGGKAKTKRRKRGRG